MTVALSERGTWPTLLLDFDINGTLVLQDSSKNAEWGPRLVSSLADNTYEDWDGINGKMSFQDYIYKILLPGDKSDQALKKHRREKKEGFITWLQEHQHPALEKVLLDIDFINKKFTNPLTKEVEPKVFPSFYKLLDKLRELQYPFIMKLRTFGSDLSPVVKEIESHPSGITFKRWGSFSGTKLTLQGQGTIDKVDEIFHTFATSKEHFAIKDDWKTWNADGERGRSGKPFIFDSKGQAHGIKSLSLFFDDNYTGKEEDIIHPIDIANDVVNSDSLKNKILFQVNTIEAMKDDDYFVKLVKKSFDEHKISVSGF